MHAPFLCGCALLLLAARPAFATTYHVAPDSSGDVLNIQAAIDAATSSDEILLSDGTFHGDGNWDLNFGTKDLVLRSVNGYEATTIDCGCFDDPNWSQHRGIILEGGQAGATQIEGITVQSSYSGVDGGAFLMVGASPLIRHVRIQGNPAFNRGAGMFVHAGSPVMEDCVFVGYWAGSESGSAIYGEQSLPNVQRCSFHSFHGVAVHVDGGTFADCTFTNNAGNDDSQGTALFASGHVSILGCTFSHTFGSSVTAGSGSLIDGCRFENNVGDYGVRVEDVTIRNSVFLGNDAAFTASAIECVGAVSLDGCVFAYNDKDAITVAGVSALTVTRCTFVGNGSHTYMPEGPGSSIASLWGNPSITMDHSIVAFGGSGSTAVSCPAAPAELSVICTDIFGNPGGDWTDCIAGMDAANGNLSADPLFCDLAAGDLRVSAGSPCAPGHSGECDLIGALGVGCGLTALEGHNWGSIKALYR